MSRLLSKIAAVVRTSLLITAPIISVGAFAAPLTQSTPVVATVQDNSNYPASFFNQYQPQNAMDMVNQLPGFNFDRGDHARGFGGNAGNVLINGARPTSKSGGLRGALQRIPAAQVERIEILRGGVSAGEAAGQAVVANVIQRKDITSGTWALKFRQTDTGSIKPNLEAAISTTIGQWNGAFDIDLGQGPNTRVATISDYDGQGDLIERADELRDQLGRWAFTNAQLDREFESGKLTLNGRAGTDTWSSALFRDITNEVDVAQSWALDERNTFKTLEFGVDWVQSFDDWKWHSLGIFQVEGREYRNESIYSEAEMATSVSHYKQDRLAKEFIVRNTYGYAGSNAFKPEFGFELANNSLVSELDYREDGLPVELSNANITVEELRGEFFASFVYSYSDALSLEGGLTAEFSQIKVDGENAQKQNFDFIKPRVAANYQINDDLSLSLEAKHTVGQLDFNDFVASSEAEDGRDVSGNSELVPEQVSQVSATIDWSFSEKGSVKFEAYHHWHSDILEHILLTSGDATFGNAGDSTMWGVNTNITLPIDAVLDNGLLEINYNHRDTEYFDPIIMDHRITSNYLPDNLRIKFRQDLVEYKLAWGGQYFNHFKDTGFYVDELIRFTSNDRVKFFVETTYFEGVKIQFEVNHANTGEYTRTRHFYEGNRNGSYTGKQVSQRIRKPDYKLSIWGTF